VRWWLLALAGCGRLDFGARAVEIDAPAPDAPAPSLAEQMPCETQLLLDSGGHDPHDIIRWVHDATGDYIIGAHHYNQDDHRIERHVLVGAQGGAVAGPADFMVQADHIDVIAFEPSAGSIILGYNDFVLQTGHTVALGPGFSVGAQYALGMLASGNPPLARGGNGSLAMIGITANALQVLGIADDGSPDGRATQITTPGDGTGFSTLVALDDGLLAIWQSSAKNDCTLAKLDTNLAIVAGPIEMGVPGCGDPHAAWLPGPGRIISVGDDTANGAIAARVWDASLKPIAPPITLATSAHWARIVAEGDQAWVTWAQTPSPQPVVAALIDANAAIVKSVPGVGAIDETLGHFHAIERVGPTTMVTWTDTAQSRTFSAERLCP
jgi:hypothetical protein